MDVPAKATAELIKSGAVDVFLSIAGYGVGKVAPKISKTAAKISEKAGQFGDDVTRIANKAQAKGAELMDEFNEGLQKLGKTLIPETELATPNGAKFDPSEISKRRTPLDKISDPMEMRGDHRINIRKGSGKTGTGMDYAWRKHGGSGTPNKSQFSISREEAEALLQRKDVIKSSARKDATSGNYIREVDVGTVVGNIPLNKGGQSTSIITVITDEVGNLINYFPGKLDFQAQ